jgi:plastocyanin
MLKLPPLRRRSHSTQNSEEPKFEQAGKDSVKMHPPFPTPFSEFLHAPSRTATFLPAVINTHTTEMKKLFAVLLTGFAVSLTAGDLTGTVTLKGTAPAEKEITPLKEDATCGKLVTGTPKTTHYVVGAKGELANVVVIVKGVAGAKSTGASAAPVVIDQKSCTYVPHILAVQTGQKIVVKNSDPVLHNVHTTPTVAGNEEKNLAQLPNAADLTLSFDKPENFLRFKCDVHPWMFAYVCVVDHPYFAVTGADGSFKIANVPPGKYTVTALHRKASPTGVDQEVEVTADGGKADFTLEAK